MLNLILFSIIGFVVCILVYYGVIRLIKMWTGCNDNEAVAKLQRFVNGTPTYKFEEDIGLQNEIWENVKKIIGERRYQQLVSLSSTSISTPMFFSGVEGLLPFIAVSLYYADDNERRVLENIIVNVAKKYLQVYGYNTAILVVWKERYDLNMPFLRIQYARNEEESKILALGIRNQHQIISMQNTAVTDDVEEELNER